MSLKRILILFVATGFLALHTSSIVQAVELTEADIKSLVFEWPMYEDAIPKDTTCTTTGQSVTGSLPSTVPGPWNEIITAAAKKFNTNGHLLAAILYWENREFPPENKEWGVSSAGAKGPMQFIDSTWEGYKTDGDNDGKADVLNNWDAVFSAAKLLSANGVKPNTALGSLDTPGKSGTLLRAAANYNWGGGNVEDNGGENITLDDMPTETSDYLKAVYTLISSNFSSLPMADGSTDKTPGGTSGGSIKSNDPCVTNNSVGTGTGNFNDSNTTTVPGADKAIAKAKELAAAGPGTWQAVCDGSPNCLGRCERLAAVVWGRTSSGYYTALDHWRAAQGAGRAHPGDRSPPKGALLYYESGQPAGHVAVYLGGNMVISNDVGDSSSGHTGGVYIVPASDMEKTGWGLTYLGWVEPVPWI